jgi:CRP-like cAMP-binding protein
MSARILSVLRALPMFSAISPDCCERLAQHAQIQHLEKGSTLFLQGEKATALRFVVSGWVKLYRVAPCGNEAIIRLMPRNRSVEEMAALKGANHTVSAETVTESTILRVDAAVFRSLANSEACVASAMIDAVVDHARVLTEDLEHMKVRSGVQRLALFLVRLAEETKGAAQIRLPYEKHLIAGRLGMKPESLSRALGRLRDQGVSIRDNEVKIADVQALHAYAVEDPALAWV